MIERIYILVSVDPVIFYGVNNSNMQLIKTLFPKLRIVARGNVMKVIGDEDESELFLKKSVRWKNTVRSLTRSPKT
mgnify:FL=1